MCTRFTNAAHSLLFRFLLPTLLCVALAACNSSSSSSSNNGDKSNDSDNTNDNGNGGNGNGGSDNTNDNGNGGNGGSGSSVAKRFITLEELGKGNLFYAINLSVDASADDSDQKITKVAEGDEQVAAFEEHSQDIQLVVTKATTEPDFDNSNEVPTIAIMSFSLEASTDLLIFQAADEPVKQSRYNSIDGTNDIQPNSLGIHFLKPETAYTIWYRIGSRVVRGSGFSTTPADDTTTDTSGSTTYTWDNGLAQLATQSIRFTVRVGEPVPDFPGYVDYTPDVDISYIEGYYHIEVGTRTFWENVKGVITPFVSPSAGYSIHAFYQKEFPDVSTDVPLHVFHYNPATFDLDNSSDVKDLDSLRVLWEHSLYEMNVTLVNNSIFSLRRSFSFRYIP